ncbi:uncharacterized protein LTHEOB_200 [Lasiodiplodia theobromae]|uniref:uncharacterized protein n=1 Tax=Lasiodiplodia theobromae TaxID=45133 RepID=UPI0015C2FD66|nr:uncharacterized protein LTHEOB_200 [Lasiodiplodia theobromae]KAF4543501.1 hypothetical protein LTHEOB_200 [Lasiodiplodia theobromae]
MPHRDVDDVVAQLDTGKAAATASPQPEPLDNPFLTPRNADPGQIKQRKRKKLPSWLDHFNGPDLKALFKSSVAVWIGTILIFIDPVLNSYGQALFFAPILLFILPSTGVVLMSVLGGVSAILGMALGWAWGVITMKAALATRPAADTAAQLAALSQSVAAAAQKNISNPSASSGQSAYAQQLIFDGAMLDARVVATYFCMLGLFIYLMARLKAAAPKLALITLFAIIVSDIFLTIAPLLPSFQGAIPQVLIKPAATAIGINVVCNLLFFPESTSHICLRQVGEVVRPVGEFVGAYAAFLAFHDQVCVNEARVVRSRRDMLVAFKALQANLAFLPLDFSFGCWKAEDVESLRKPLEDVLAAFMGMLNLATTQSASAAAADGGAPAASTDAASRPLSSSSSSSLPGSVPIVQLLSRVETAGGDQAAVVVDQPLWGGHLDTFQTSSQPLLSAIADTVSAIIEGVELANKRRWFGRLSAEEYASVRQRHRATIAALERELDAFSKLNTERILARYDQRFDEHGARLDAGDKKAIVSADHAKALLATFVFEERLCRFGGALKGMLERVVQIEEERPTPRLWFPTKIRHAAAWVFSKDEETLQAAESSDASSGDGPEDEKKVPDDAGDDTLDAEQLLATLRRHHGRKRRGAVGRFLLALTKWFGNAEGMYALRMLVVSIALALPATALTMFMSDFTYSFIIRIAGTVTGGVVGLVCWYIGAGNGPGNPYGMAAIMAPVIICIMWFRLYAPSVLLPGVMLVSATMFLVVGYSWDDTHIPSYGNPGVGYEIFWRRILLVVIGFFAAAIVTLLPRPPSAARHITKTLSASLRANQDILALSVLAWRHAVQGKSVTSVSETVTAATIDTFETLSALVEPIQLLRFEFSSSVFDSATLMAVVRAHGVFAVTLAQLHAYTASLPPAFRQQFAAASGVLDDDGVVVGEVVAVLNLVGQTLKTGDALPAVLKPRMAERMVERMQRVELEPVSRERVCQSEFRRYCVALNSLLGMMEALDELVVGVKGAVGETYSVGFSTALE